MKVAGEALLDAPVEQVWNALLDPAVLVRTIPGCERLVPDGDNSYGMTVTTGVAAVRGTYAGSYELHDLQPHESMTVKAACAGAPGTINADVKVGFADQGGRTLLRYDADAVVGGMVGGVGQRMLTSVSRRMANEFFRNIEQAITAPAEAVPGPAAAVPAAPSAEAPREYLAPSAPAVPSAGRDFLKGVLVGGGLVLAGVVAGALAARRRS